MTSQPDTKGQDLLLPNRGSCARILRPLASFHGFVPTEFSIFGGATILECSISPPYLILSTKSCLSKADQVIICYRRVVDLNGQEPRYQTSPRHRSPQLIAYTQVDPFVVILPATMVSKMQGNMFLSTLALSLFPRHGS